MSLVDSKQPFLSDKLKCFKNINLNELSPTEAVSLAEKLTNFGQRADGTSRSDSAAAIFNTSTAVLAQLRKRKSAVCAKRVRRGNFSADSWKTCRWFCELGPPKNFHYRTRSFLDLQ